MQIIAEQRMENGLLSVTLKILNLSNFLYTEKSCKFFQSYENILMWQSDLEVYLPDWPILQKIAFR